MRSFVKPPVALLPLLGALWLAACSSGGPAVPSVDMPPEARPATTQSHQQAQSVITDGLAARGAVAKIKGERERDRPAMEEKFIAAASAPAC